MKQAGPTNNPSRNNTYMTTFCVGQACLSCPAVLVLKFLPKADAPFVEGLEYGAIESRYFNGFFALRVQAHSLMGKNRLKRLPILFKTK